MPKRQTIQTIISAEMQGDDSFIKLVPPTMEQMKIYRSKIKPLQEQLEQLKAAGKTETSAEIGEVNEAISNEGRNLIGQFVSEWNWVDNDDKPLPQPHEKGAVDLLNIREVKWLMKQLQFDDSEKKGS